MKIGYLGPKGTFSFEACLKYNKDALKIEYKTITDLINGVEKNEIDEAIVPIENSIQGGVTETIDTLSLIEGIYIKNELVLKIVQNLIANKNYKKEEIKEIYSHPQAIAQCRNYILKNIPNAKIIEVSSTALAAKEIKNKDYAACIANSSCIDEYALTLLEDNIQENNLNETKFWVLSKEKNNIGKKMSIIFSTKHKPGALYKILGILNENSINMTKIESRPAKTVLGEYIFLVDIDVNENVDKMYTALKEECTYLRNLGLY